MECFGFMHNYFYDNAELHVTVLATITGKQALWVDMAGVRAVRSNHTEMHTCKLIF